ncbi:MAG: ribonuclease E inhibitor RraB [Terriglobales bacterium]
MGQLVRVLPGLVSSRPSDFAELSQRKELYFAFYTLSYALRDQQTEVVSNQPVPKWAQPYPLMRWCGARDSNGRAIAWKIFGASSQLTLDEHQRTPLIHNLTPEQQRLSIHQLWPHPVIVKELARGWTPSRAEELRLQDVAEARKQNASGTPEKRTAEPMKHYLYFSKKLNAEEAGERLRIRGFSVEVRKGADGETWLALATKAPPRTVEQMDELRDEMEALAAQFGGEYDGWEAAIDSLGSRNAGHGQEVN